MLNEPYFDNPAQGQTDTPKRKINYLFILVIIICAILAVVFYVLLKKVSIIDDGVSDIAESLNPLRTELFSTKEKIMEIALSNGPLSKENRNFVISAIAGNQINQYGFSDDEKIKIINALNRTQ